MVRQDLADKTWLSLDVHREIIPEPVVFALSYNARIQISPGRATSPSSAECHIADTGTSHFHGSSVRCCAGHTRMTHVMSWHSLHDGDEHDDAEKISLLNLGINFPDIIKFSVFWSPSVLMLSRKNSRLENVGRTYVVSAPYS